jgi:serine/threonine protein phosphatase PrpC
MMLEVVYGSATDRGAVRPRNEDRVLAEPCVFAVADGLGGHAAGDVAASLAVDRLRRLAGRPDLCPEDLRSAVAEASDEIVIASASRDEWSGMATTLAALAVVSVGGAAHWAVCNVGDSRVYRFSAGRLWQLSVDHSEVQELVSVGKLTPDEARAHPSRAVITRSLGTDPGPKVDLWMLPAAAGDRFLLCSDGLLELADSEVEHLLSTTADPQVAADLLVRRAVEAGGRDNVSVVVVDLPTAQHDVGEPTTTTMPRSRLTDGL